MSQDEMKHPEKVAILDQGEDYTFGDLFRAVRARLQFEHFDGEMSGEITRIAFQRGDSVAVLLYDPRADVVVLTRQFRFPIYAGMDPEVLESEGASPAWSLEVVGGTIEPGHTAHEIATREVLEEVGYAVRGGLRPITAIYTSPGWTSERMFIFLGLIDYEERLHSGGGLPSEGEDIQVEILPFQEALLMIEQGEVGDAKTIIALQHLALLKSRGVEL